MQDFIPKALVAPYFAFGFLGGEVADWQRRQAMGLVGRSGLFVLAVQTTAAIAWIFELLSLAAYGYDHGWVLAIAVFILITVASSAGVIIKWIYTNVLPEDACWVLRVVFVPMIYVVMFIIALNLSWFGLFHR